MHLSDLHADMSEAITQRVAVLIGECQYDICVLTGDYRALTFGSSIAALAGMAHIRSAIKSPAFGVLGNHDFIMMLPELEGMGIKLLLNESIGIQRDDAQIYLAGLDDANYFQADNIEEAAANDFGKAIIRSCFRTRPKSIAMPRMPDFISCWRDTRMAVKSVCRAAFPLPLISISHAGLGQARGVMKKWRDIPRSERAVHFPVRFNCPPEITLHRLIAVQ